MNKDAEPLPLSVDEKLDAACDRFEAELKAGRTPQIEVFLKQFAGSARSTLLNLLLQVEIELLSGKGERLEPKTYHERFPDYADVVTAAFTRLSTQRNASSDTASQHRSPVETASHRDSKSEVQEQPNKMGRFQIQKVLGEGAMGAVYLAHDPKLKRKVALKVPKFNAESGPEILERFHREAQAAATLNHRNICQVFDVDEEEGQPFIAIAFVEGRPLSEFINPQKPIPQKTAAFLVRKIARALDHAHKNDVVHRDLKPDNIMIDKEKEPVVTDFGLACRTDSQQSRMTKDGTVLGTPAYMPIEQVNGEIDRIGPASDVYSLGVILFELLTGDIPFQGSVTAVIGQILTQQPPRPSELRSGIDLRLEAICLKAMAKQIEDRYSSMAEFADALTGYLRGKQQPVSDKGLSPVQASQDRTASTATVAGETGLSALFAAVAADDNASATVGFDQEPAEATRNEPTSRKSSGQALSKRWNSIPPAGQWGVRVGAVTLLILLGIVLFVRTDKGATVRIEIFDADLKAQIGTESFTIQDKGRVTDVEIGDHTLRITSGGLTAETEKFVIRDGDQVRLKVELINGEVVVTKDGNQKLAAKSIESKSSPNQKQADRGDQKIPQVINEELQPIATEIDKGVPNDSRHPQVKKLREKLSSLRLKHYGTPAAIEAAMLMSKLRWPVDDFKREETDPYEWKIAGGGDAKNAPKDLVRIIGDSRLLHGSHVNTLEYSTDGKRLLSTSSDFTAVIWDMETGRAVQILPHTSQVIGARFSPDNRLVASCELRDETIEQDTIPADVSLWDAATGQLKAVFKGEHINSVRRLAWTKDGKHVISVDYPWKGSKSRDRGKHAIVAWDVDAGKADWKIEQEQGVLTVAIHPSGELLATAGESKSINLWKVEDGAPHSVLVSGHSKRIFDLTFSKDGKLLAAAGDDGTARVWSLATGKPTHVLKNGSFVSSIRFLDSSTIITAGGGGEVRRWDLADDGTSQFTRLYDDNHNIVDFRAAVLDSTCQLLAVAGTDSGIRLRSLADRTEVRKNPNQDLKTYQAAMSLDGSVIETIAPNGDIFTWAVQDAKLLRRIAGQKSLTPRGVTVSPKGDFIADPRVWRSTPVKFFDSAQERTWRPPFTGFYAVEAAISPNSELIAVATREPNRVLIRNVLTGQQTAEIKLPREPFMLMFSPDGTQLLTTGYGDRSIHLWDVATGESLGNMTAHASGMESIDWSADGRFLVSSDTNNGGELIVWNVAERKALTQLITPQMRDEFGRCRFCKFSPDGRLIAARVKLDVIHFWNATTFEPLGTMQINAEHINTGCSNLFFTADGRHIVTANANGTLSVLRIPGTILAGEQAAQAVPADSPIAAVPAGVASGQVSPVAIPMTAGDQPVESKRLEQAILPSLVWVSCRRAQGGGVSRLGVVTDQQGFICIHLSSGFTPTKVTRIQDGKQYEAKLVETTGTIAWVQAEGLNVPRIAIGDLGVVSKPRPAWLVDANRLQGVAPNMVQGEILAEKHLGSPKIQFPVQHGFRPVFDAEAKLLGITLTAGNKRAGSGYMLQRIRKAKLPTVE